MIVPTATTIWAIVGALRASRVNQGISDYLRKGELSKVKASKAISRSLPAFMAAMPGNGVIALRYRAQRFSVNADFITTAVLDLYQPTNEGSGERSRRC
jgi:hypothetical protein